LFWRAGGADVWPEPTQAEPPVKLNDQVLGWDLSAQPMPGCSGTRNNAQEAPLKAHPDGGLVDQHPGISFRHQPRLAALLRQVTGIDDVKPGSSPGMIADSAIGAKSTQRISLQAQDGGLALCTFPAELKDQARALYRTSRAQRLMDFLAADAQGWQASPNVHLAFWRAPPSQRLYLHCQLGTTEYIHRWLGDDFTQVGAHHYGSIRADLWPWLQDASTPDPEMTSMNSWTSSAACTATLTCVRASSCSAPGPGRS
jgi:hypothetical protein